MFVWKGVENVGSYAKFGRTSTPFKQMRFRFWNCWKGAEVSIYILLWDEELEAKVKGSPHFQCDHQGEVRR